jgi:hypothetical protein
MSQHSFDRESTKDSGYLELNLPPVGLYMTSIKQHWNSLVCGRSSNCDIHYNAGDEIATEEEVG